MAAEGRAETPEPIYFESPEQLRDWFDANHETATELWVGYWKKAAGRPTVTWAQAVDEALCVGWIDTTRYSVDDGAVPPAVHAAPEGEQLERRQRRQRRAADEGGPDAAGRPPRVRGADRGADRPSTRTSSATRPG